MASGSLSSSALTFVGNVVVPFTIVATLVAVPVALIVKSQQQEKISQEDAADELTALGGDVAFAEAEEASRVHTRKVIAVDLHGTEVKDASLQDLAKLPSVSRVDLSQTQISDAGLVELAKIHDLQFVDLRETNVTADGIAKLQRLHPSVEIRFGEPPPKPTRAFLRRSFRNTNGVGLPGSGLGSIADPTSASGARASIAQPPEATTIVAIDRGLAFLSSQQQADGSWRLRSGTNVDEEPAIESIPAATGLALLAYLGAGYHHREGPYHDDVARGLAYLLDHQKIDGSLHNVDDGDTSSSVRFYSHAIAALALCEAYGMTQDRSLRESAQAAVHYIESTQHEGLGGWRYRTGVGSDTSVTGWLIMVLKSAELANLDVQPKTLTGVRKWLDQAQLSAEQPYLHVYNPQAPDTVEQRHGRQPTPAMTSVGLLMRLYLEWRRDNKDVQQGADYLLANAPRHGTPIAPARDAYYWYYGTQVMLHMHGERWNEWNAKLHPLLVDHQITEGKFAGSWDPRLPVIDRWGLQGGRLYVTAMNLLTLEVYYRHLPIYDEISK